uniref:UspA domain-containing protein n=1 Tax=Lotharella globosa TaxID=91324 RepID=A0A6V3JQ06_9EUKA
MRFTKPIKRCKPWYLGSINLISFCRTYKCSKTICENCVSAISICARTQAKEKASKNLRKYSQQMENLGRKPDNLVVMLAEPQEKAKYALLKYVEKVKPDFLVCGSRGMGAMGRMLLGSTSDFLAHSASCSVVIVKGEPKAKEIDVDVLVDEGEENAVAEGKEEKDSS